MRILTVGLIFVFAVSSAALCAQTATANSPDECSLTTLPQSVQDYLLKYDGAWRIQEVKDLAPRAHERWEAEKPLRCPGIASGRFDAAKEFSYAVLLVPVGRGGAGHRLIAFSPVRGSHSYIPKVLGESKDTKSSALFVHTIRIGSFFDPQSKEKFRVQAPSGILFIEADDKAYEADVYFWGSGSYQKQPIDY